DQLDLGRRRSKRAGNHARRVAGRYDVVVLVLTLIGCSSSAAASPTCPEALDELGVRWRPATPRPGIAQPVEVRGPLGGVTYVPWGKPKPLVLDCSLVEALARSGPFLTAQGLVIATYSGGYNVRNIRGTNKPSSHS